jgi:hypothetical protein
VREKGEMYVATPFSIYKVKDSKMVANKKGVSTYIQAQSRTLRMQPCLPEPFAGCVIDGEK